MFLRSALLFFLLNLTEVLMFKLKKNDEIEILKDPNLSNNGLLPELKNGKIEIPENFKRSIYDALVSNLKNDEIEKPDYEKPEPTENTKTVGRPGL